MNWRSEVAGKFFRRATPGFFALGVGLALALVATGGSLRAQPTGGQVVSGAATFDAAPGALSVTQTSDRAIIHWQDFSLATGELARFVQPAVTSATLNRVISGLPSTLAGTLQANGRVYLINPNGIMIGGAARIDTAGFLASTLDVANQEFLAGGDLHFGGDSTAAIMNLGTINARGGDVFLIARQVENSGTIAAGNGSAGLAAGSEILLTAGGAERLFVRAASLPGTIVNAGAIAATTAELKAAGGNVFALAINNSGTVRATGSELRNGEVWLVASGGEAAVVSVSGTIDASAKGTGQTGGSVSVLGQSVGLHGNAVIDVSGDAGGGTALIGGNFQGKGPERNATATYLGANSTITADAITKGSGGRVIVWADGLTRYYGNISARGGAEGGNGGFTEISGKGTLVFGGQVDLRGSSGRTGTLLLDPTNITIQAAGPNVNGDGTVGDDLNFAANAPNILLGDYPGITSVITNTQIVTQLNTANVTLQATNDITVAAAIDASGNTVGKALTLEAGHDVIINAALTTSSAGGGSLILNAGNNVTVGAALTANGGNVTLRADNDGTGPGLAGGTVTFGAITAANLTLRFNPVSYSTTSGEIAAYAPKATLTGTFDAKAWTFVNNASATAQSKPYDGLTAAALSAPFALKSGPDGVTAGQVVSLTAGSATFNSAHVASATTVAFAGYALSGGGDSANYALFSQPASQSQTITAKTLTPTLTNNPVTKIYDSTTAAPAGFSPSFSYAGLVSGDTAATLANTGSVYNDKNVVGANKVTVSGLSLTGITGVSDGNSGNNYTLTQANNTTSTINPAALTLSGTRVYNGTTFFAGSALTATGVNGESFTVTGAGDTTNLATKNVQTNQVLTSVTGLAVGTGNTGAALATNYNSLATAGSAVSVTAASLTASTSNVIKTYSGDTTALGTAVVTAGTLFGTDTLSGGTFAFTTKDVGLANKTVTVSGVSVSDGNGGNNYTLTQAANTTSTINPATLTYTANAAARLVGGVDPAFSGTISGFVAGETQATVTTGIPVFSTTAIITSPTGLYPIVGSGLTANNGNYLFVQAPGNATAFNIGSLTPLIITADNKTKTYGAALPTFTATYDGFINGDSSASVTGLQYSTLATIGSNVGTFTITPFGATAPPHYLVGYVPGILTINPATLTYTANVASRLIGAADPAFSGTISGFVAGDTQATVTTGIPVFGTTAINTSPAGLYPINGSGLTANHGNYLFVQAPGNATAFTIGSLASLIITADNKTKTYGAALPAFTATYAGFINGDTAASVTGLQYSTLATIGSNVGTFTITPFGATAPPYYLVGYVPGTLTINPAALTLTANNATRLYGAANPPFGATFAGLVNGDTSAVVTGLQLNTPATPATNVGAYAITPSGATAQNYALTFVPGTLTIERASLTLTAADAAREFGAANPPFTGIFRGFVNDDTAAVVGGLAFRTPATATSVAGDYVITPFGATAANYTLAFVDGTLRIAAPTIPVGPTPLPLPELSQRIAIVLSDVKGWPVFENNTAVTRGAAVGGASAAGEPNQGGFELVTSFPGRTQGNASTGSGVSQGATRMGEPGLVRESSVNMGGFNVVYRETVAAANQQEEANTALGSSYREFSETENPRVRLLRAREGRPPTNSGAPGNPQRTL